MSEKKRRQRLVQWPRVALTTAGVLVAASATTFVVRTGDAATTTADFGTTPTRTVVAIPGPRTSTPAPAPVTVTVTVPGLPLETPVLVPPPAAAATPMAQTMVDPREIVYTVAGNQRPDDPVSITYADDTGALRTVENVALPWRLTVIPTVPVNYVTASSGGSQLNCWITDAHGATVAAQTDNTISATCNR
ncbi:MmpS family transport accessory protein [Mycobacterium sp. CVI_P3]|uniref:MmpS family transport accessory protein n=1 Tax=Mycobacterium pinniadriaticum TaxID=2994102 RepID=A0ABT3SMQ1_9MYCO|nr:MmpS family transport accessory protein [Mycobacterium pinniadriaticum]MCX2934377.1 MmpS family transport accessory protein [Mycobacterium pinniadriaticum]MCX2940800.1 MmpS family transport accessory protein [Mycobacterium pinniadriaticum]